MRYSFFDSAYFSVQGGNTKCSSELFQLQHNFTNWVMVCVSFVIIGIVVIFHSASQGNQIPFHDDELDPLYLQNDYNESKLPTDISPVSYEMYLDPRIALKAYTGFTKIQILCKHVTSQIILYSSQHKIKNMKVMYQNKQVDIQSYYRNNEEMLILKLSRNLTAGMIYELFIDFHNTLTYGLKSGIYLDTFWDAHGKKQ